ncbi:immunoglobulin kappa light chain-like isoform X2 [Kryptolebias marmoratus]|uniref:immunoglobulin kappa light chain-like isoform X2 n=1 Tax=Kryptolebias marmoratus TaxID=37003 RepID=UPI000D5303A3|nr:immunoglobulin kappa light chain-like isoform X2 [Kryptolebias marmoratus]
MTSAQFLFCLTSLLVGTMVQTAHTSSSPSVHQDSRFISTHVGDKLNLRCSYEDADSAWISWYKQTLGHRPKLIASFLVNETKIHFYDEFMNNPRFILDKENQTNQLIILNLKVSDSATYYCGLTYAKVVILAEGTTVSVKGSGLTMQALVHQSASETVHPGGSVTLNCTVQTGSCDGEHSVYWFRNSEESHPGLIYVHGGRNDQCERNPNNQTHTCVSKLSLKNLNRSHVGTYYCAVVSCGHILFGDGTKLDFKCDVDSVVSMYFMRGALALTTFLSVFQAFLLFLIYKRNGSIGRGPCSICLPSASIEKQVDQNEEGIYYAALRHQNVNRLKRQKNEKTDCVYSSVKQ